MAPRTPQEAESLAERKFETAARVEARNPRLAETLLAEAEELLACAEDARADARRRAGMLSRMGRKAA